MSPEFINSYNLQYAGNIYMGELQQEINDIIWDTGSSWLVLDTIDCSSCIEQEPYDYTTSTAYSEIPNSSMSMAYGDGTSIKGV